MPLLLFTSGFLIHRNNEMLAWVLAIVFFLMILLLLFTLFRVAAPA
jgi:hypothetical protein